MKQEIKQLQAQYPSSIGHIEE